MDKGYPWDSYQGDVREYGAQDLANAFQKIMKNGVVNQLTDFPVTPQSDNKVRVGAGRSCPRLWDALSQQSQPSKLISLYHPRWEMGSPSPLLAQPEKNACHSRKENGKRRCWVPYSIFT